MMSAITVFEKKTYDAERRKIIAQAKGVDIVTKDTFVPMFRFIKWMTPVFLEETVPIKVWDNQPVNESEQCRLLEEDAALFNRDRQAQSARWIAMLVVGLNPTAGFPDPW